MYQQAAQAMAKHGVHQPLHSGHIIYAGHRHGMRMLALKSGQLRHCSQFLSWLKVTVLWPSPDRSSPRKLSYMYHTQKAPTVAKPTYAPTSIHLPQAASAISIRQRRAAQSSASAQPSWKPPALVPHIVSCHCTHAYQRLDDLPCLTAQLRPRCQAGRGEYRKKSQAVTSSSLDFRGGFCMMSTSGGLKPSAVAGGPSVTRFTHKSCRRRRSLRWHP